MSVRAVGLTRKGHALDTIESHRQRLIQSFDGLSAKEMVQPLADDEWSVKDILTHVTSWEELILLDLRRIQRGRRPARYHAGNDAWNPVLMQGRDAFPLDQVLNEFQQVHDSLVDLLTVLNEDLFPGEVTGICNVLSLHDWEHSEQIKRWRASQQRP